MTVEAERKTRERVREEERLWGAKKGEKISRKKKEKMCRKCG